MDQIPESVHLRLYLHVVAILMPERPLEVTLKGLNRSSFVHLMKFSAKVQTPAPLSDAIPLLLTEQNFSRFLS